MKIILESPSAEKIQKTREIYQKHARNFLKDFFIILKNDIINKINNKQSLDFTYYREDLQDRLRMIYKKIIINNPNYLLSNQTIITNKKAKVEIQKFDNIKKDLFEKHKQEAERKSEQQAKLIINNLESKLTSLSEKATHEFYSVNQSMQAKINEIKQKIEKLNIGLIYEYTIQTKKKLEKELKRIEKRLNNRQENFKDIIQNTFLANYDEQITNGKSTIIADNEINYFDQITRHDEAEALKSTQYITTSQQETLKQKKEYKRWNTRSIGIANVRSRDNHVALNGKVIPVNEKFEVQNPKTGFIEYADCPKDPSLSPENSIGCHCIATYFIIYTKIS